MAHPLISQFHNRISHLTKSFILDFVGLTKEKNCIINTLVKQKSKIQLAIDNAGKWLDYDEVEAVSQGMLNDQLAIIVFVSGAKEDFRDIIPSTFMDFPVIIEETGKFEIS